ncbi:hypothetical protein POF45_25495 [Pseudomonas sp. 681]|uniref:N-acetyltransferase domain-containing protein n=1 Tax=Pseudomonas fungipugnans TaxID=3024217 RepID=A0ABT6QV20_9PSED|nr:hypothetical protein [Pseudomonas sp. 681]MDI2594757.1 hypothetical protein [Pseudomonas sp. 681]
MAEENANKILALLTVYLSREFSNSKSFGESVMGHTVNAHGEDYEFYLRVTPPPGGIWDSETLVIARIGFKDRRRGYGRNFMEFLVECASTLGYSKIGMECTNENSEAFGRRLGLQGHGPHNHLLGTVFNVACTLDRKQKTKEFTNMSL